MRSPIRLLLEKLAELESKKPRFFLLLVAILSIILLVGLARLEVMANMEKMIPSNLQVLRDLNTIREGMGGGDILFIVLSISPGDRSPRSVLDERFLRYLADLEERLSEIPQVSSIESPRLMLQSGLVDRAIEESLVSRDLELAVLRIVSSVGDSEEETRYLMSEIYRVLEETPRPEGVNARVTGIIPLRSQLFRLITSDLIRMSILALVGIFSILLVIFEDPRTFFLPLVSVCLALIWTLGLIGYAGVPLSVMTISVAPMLLGIGVDYGIHISYRMNEEMRRGTPNPIEPTLVHTGEALLFACLTTFAGFASLTLATMPGVIHYGATGALGILCSALVAILLVPPATYIMRRIVGSGSKMTRFQILHSRFARSMVSIARRRYKILLSLIILLLLTFGHLSSRMRMETMMEKTMPRYLPEIQGIYEMRDRLGGADVLPILVEVDGITKTDVLDPEIMRNLEVLEEEVRDVDGVIGVFGPPDIVLSSIGYVPSSREDLARILSGSDLISDDLRMCVLMVFANAETQERMVQIIEDIKEKLELITIPGARLGLTGSLAVSYETGRLMGRDFGKVTMIAFFAVLILLYASFGNIKDMFVFSMPLIVTLAMTFGTLAVLDIPMRPEQIGIASTLLGIGIDYCIHLYKRYLEERERSSSSALEITIEETGGAIFGSATTTIVGFSALMSAQLPALRVMGFALAMGMFYCWLITTIYFSSVISLREARGS